MVLQMISIFYICCIAAVLIPVEWQVNIWSQQMHLQVVLNAFKHPVLSLQTILAAAGVHTSMLCHLEEHCEMGA